MGGVKKERGGRRGLFKRGVAGGGGGTCGHEEGVRTGGLRSQKRRSRWWEIRRGWKKRGWY